MVLKTSETKSSNKSSVGNISFSGIEQYLGCGEQYRRVHAGEKRPPAIALAEGICTDHALTMNNISKRDKGKDLKPRKLIEISMGNLEEQLKAPEVRKMPKAKFWGEVKKDDCAKRANAWFNEYIRKHAAKITPRFVQQPFITPVKVSGVEFNVTGFIDLTTKAKRVIDYKTSSSVKSQKEVDSSLQLTLYSYCTKLVDVGFYNFVKTKNPYIAYLKSRRSPAQWQWGLMVAASVYKSIQAQLYPLADPNPRNWRCSEKFCGFWSTCRGKYEK